MSRMHVVDLSRIKGGDVTDIYFQRTKTILEKNGTPDVRVVAEVHSYSLPQGYEWAVLTGVEEAAWLFEGLPVDVYAMEEGTLFREVEPVLAVEGRYVDFAVYEPALLGILRHATSVATKAAMVKRAAGSKPVLFFGIRSVHPALAAMVDRSAYIGGCDAVSGIVGAELIGVKPMGTMPHSLIIVLGDQKTAWRLFHEVMPEDVPRIALVDTFFDERLEALMAAETLGKNLYGVRLDTPSSRRGNIRKIVEETRWTLDLHGYRHVKIFVSGGLDENSIRELRDLVDGFGVGTSIAFPTSVDLALDIVEKEGRPVSKRGKLPGRKQVYRCPSFHDTIASWKSEVSKCPICGDDVKPLLSPLIKNGKIVKEVQRPTSIRNYVLDQLKILDSLKEPLIKPILYP